jgi:hypothetical protein
VIDAGPWTTIEVVVLEEFVDPRHPIKVVRTATAGVVRVSVEDGGR